MHFAPSHRARTSSGATLTVASGHYAARLGRAIAVAGLAALAAGFLVGGIGSRLAMRLVTVLGDPADVGGLTEAQARVGDITFGGTTFLVVSVTVISTVIGAITYVAAGPVLRGGPLARGLEFGAILLLALGSQVISADNFDFAEFATPAVTVGLIAVLFVLFGIVAVLAADRLEQRLPSVGTGRGTDAGYWATLLIGSGVVLLMVVGAVGSRAGPVAIVAIGVVVGYAALTRTTNARWVTAVGWAVVAVAVLPSGIGLMAEVVKIIGDANTSNAVHSMGAHAAVRGVVGR